MNISSNQNAPKDRPFYPWRVARSEGMRQIIKNAIASVESCETQQGLRTRKRRGSSQKRLCESVGAVLCDLSYHYLAQEPNAVAISRSNQQRPPERYRPSFDTKILRGALDLLANPSLGYVLQELGSSGPGNTIGKQTTIKAGPTLVQQLMDEGIAINHLGIDAKHEEVILLKKAKADYWDEAKVIDYKDTRATQKLRRELLALNEWLGQADVSFDHALRRDNSIPVDPSHRSLQRHFTQGRFNSGGRMYGGFWQQLKKQERLQCLRIEGAAVAELDYGQLTPRLLYGQVGVDPGSIDLYSIAGFSAHRKGVKKLFNAMVFASERLTRFPKHIRQLFPADCSVGQALKAIEGRHTLIADHFYQGLGHDLQFTESQIMMEVLATLRERGVVALPIHDGLLTRVTAASEAKEVMEHVFLKRIGITALVDIEIMPPE